MKGWLIVNGFLTSHKFMELYELYQKSARLYHMELSIKTNAEFLVCADTGEILIQDFDTYPDFVLFFDKDLRLARALEKAGLKLYNCADAIEACDDKSLTALKLAGTVRMPKTCIAPMTYSNIGYTDFSFLSLVEKQLSYPFVIKECFGSFGMQVYLAHSRSEAIELLTQNSGSAYLFQEYIQESQGRDIRIHVVGDEIITAMLRHNEHDFRANITNGGLMEPYIPTAEEARLALSVCRTLKLDFAGVDILFGKDGEPILCEVNSNAHFKNILDCTGVNVADAILNYISKR